MKAIYRESDELRSLLDSQSQEQTARNTKELAGIVADFNLGKYQESIQEKYGKLKLDSLDTTGCAYNELKLWRIFIPQNLRECQEYLPQVYEIPKEHQKRLQDRGEIEQVLALEELDRRRQAYAQQTIRSVKEVIADKTYKYLVILGDPGAGKSTLLQYIALDWAELLPKELPLQPLPLLIELRTYIRNRDLGQCKSFLEFVHQSSGVVCHLNQHQLDEKLKAGDVVVMFDGLDEVFDSGKREDVITDIHRFTNDYPNLRVIVTSRVIGYKPQKLRDAEFRHFMLQDLEAEQIDEFIQRWHDFTCTDEADKIRKRERLKKAISDSAAIRELAGNPLLLTMMAILNRNQELPRDRAELYNQASRVLLYQWDVERLLFDAKIDQVTIDYKEKQAMLRRVAYAMQANEKGLAGNFIIRGDLEKILIEYLKSIEVNDARTVARLLIEQLRSRNFILCYVGADYYAFVHRTFLEYFCAWEFVWQFKETQTLSIEQLKTEVFGKHWQDESWHEVLRLISGMIDAKFVGEIIEYLMGINGEAEKFVNLFLAAMCLSEVRNRQMIEKSANQLLKQLQDLIEYDVNYYYEPYGDEAQLVWEIGVKAVAAVAYAWQNESNTYVWLKIATNDDDWNVRRAAFQELARGWKDDPNTLPILKQRATNDDDWLVRYVAFQELARGWKDDPDTLPILKQRATNDDDLNVRRAAVQELAIGWKDEPWMFEFLRNIALNDPFVRQQEWQDNPRQIALEAIIKRYPDDLETLLLLRDRSKHDADEYVRELAQKALQKRGQS
ncbi:putative signal transduction protein containing Nacht domain [Microseira wollei NIES-4236]|uniref:Signal transduction protein containing Nacht domain n=2 Tax=Microseira wollei TaxID=467598 RepID=A0AAV3XQE4_9CYAN|nr:HEAT repeat domain-containing protein [Microseira wollei]GET44195.1 putative signal transduction protein containing Nacht domain [Microseira wollei NIES-4236]